MKYVEFSNFLGSQSLKMGGIDTWLRKQTQGENISSGIIAQDCLCCPVVEEENGKCHFFNEKRKTFGASLRGTDCPVIAAKHVTPYAFTL